jgi:UDP-N-acetylglucosamine 2-epimerase
MKITLVVGARPNFMKIAPSIRQLKVESERVSVLSQKTNDYRLKTVDYLLVHTGQHYDYEMSKVFFEDLELPEPDIYLGIGSGTHAEQTGKVMIEFEKVLFKEMPDLVMVVGDVNSTLACALVASKIDYIHSDINHNEARHSRESGNPDVVPTKAGNQEEQKHWIPGQARNDKLPKTYVVMYSKESGVNSKVDTIKGEQLSVSNLTNSKNSKSPIDTQTLRLNKRP